MVNKQHKPMQHTFVGFGPGNRPSLNEAQVNLPFVP